MTKYTDFTRPGNPTPDDQAFKVMKAALENGANVWSGADLYGTPENNSLHLMNRYITKYPEDADKVVLVIKGGVVEVGTFKIDASPEGMRKQLDNCNQILDGKKSIDVFGPARVDVKVPIEMTVASLGDFVDQGLIGGILLSEVRAETIRKASKVRKIDAVEAEVSLLSRDIFTNGVAQTCAELGIVVIAHTPLSGGMLTGAITKLEDLPVGGHHRFFPRFQGENLQTNLKPVQALQKVAATKHCTLAQLALSWIRSHNGKPGMPFILPVAGSASEKRFLENFANVDMDEDDLEEIKSIMDSHPVVGARYPGKGAELAEY